MLLLFLVNCCWFQALPCCYPNYLVHCDHLWWGVLFTLLPAQGDEGGQTQITNFDLACNKRQQRRQQQAWMQMSGRNKQRV
jgi:hypothetical protein